MTIQTLSTLSIDQLSTVTGGVAAKPIFEDGGVAGPVGSPTPTPGKSGNTGIIPPWLRRRVDQLFHRHVKPIPESGGVVGPAGSPTPF